MCCVRVEFLFPRIFDRYTSRQIDTYVYTQIERKYVNIFRQKNRYVCAVHMWSSCFLRFLIDTRLDIQICMFIYIYIDRQIDRQICAVYVWSSCFLGLWIDTRLDMGWLRSVGSIKLQLSSAEYRLFYRSLLRKRPIILLILLIVATPQRDIYVYMQIKRKYVHIQIDRQIDKQTDMYCLHVEFLFPRIFDRYTYRYIDTYVYTYIDR